MAQSELGAGAAAPAGGQPARGGHLMASALEAGGVRTLFTVPGGHILSLLDGCLDSSIRVIDTRHEGAAALAAEGWALATGETGVAAVTAGPGFANALVGLLDSAVWTVPYLLIAGRTGLHQAGRGAVMDVDQRSVAMPVAKWGATCQLTERIPRYVAEALHRSRVGRPGAVYLEVPEDVLSARAQAVAGTWGPPAAASSPAASQEAVERAAAALGRASRPVAVAGGGAFWSGAGAELARFCEVAQVPLTTTSVARGVVPDSHPWCLGSLVHGGLPLATADVVIVFGSAFNANLLYGSPPLFGEDQVIIQVDLAPEELGGNRRPDLVLTGDVAQVAAQLLAALPGVPRRESWRGEAQELAQASREMWDAQIARHEGDLLHPGWVARAVAGYARERAGGQLTMVADGGDALTWALAYFPAESPGRLLTTTTALGTLGVGMPFAIAAKAARPEEPVVLLTGDGSFGLTAMEIDTAVRHRLPMVVVVVNNAGWGDVRHHQEAVFGPGRQVASRLADTRYDRLAEALGGSGERVERREDLRPALARAWQSDGVALVDVKTDPGVISDLLKSMGQMGVM